MAASTCLRAGFLLGASLMALAQAPVALAQAVTPPPAGDEGVSEIIVTAQRREERLQDVPIAVSALSDDTLRNAGVEGTRELSLVVPSVQITQSGPAGLLFVRGVGSTNAATGDEGANAVYIDDVYVGDLSQAFTNFNNVLRVEALKGPQGTLFGRNSTGGLIHVITREPGDYPVVEGQAGYANFDTVSGQLYAATPLSDKVGIDVALTGLNQADGWGRNLTLGTEAKKRWYWGARSKLVLRPSDTVKFTFAGDYNDGFDSTALDWKLKDGVIGTAGFVGPAGWDTTVNQPGLASVRSWGISLKTEADLDFATLTSISALRRSFTDGLFDNDGGPLDLLVVNTDSTGKTVQQEFRLASNAGGPFTWQVGLFYLYSQATSELGITGGALPVREVFNDGSLTTNSYAAFGEVSYKIEPRTTLTAGMRYTVERRQLAGVQTNTLLSGVAIVGAPADQLLKYNVPSYRAALRHEFSDAINAYFSFNRSFKAGTFSLSDLTALPVRPQYINAYEIGLKTELFGRKLRLNLAAFHYDISDYQVRTGSAGGSNVFLFLNAAGVKVDGIELEFEARPSTNLRLFGGATFLDSRFSKWGGAPIATTPQAPFLYPNPATCPAGQIGTDDPGLLSPGPRTGGFQTCFGDLSGVQTPLAPDFAASLGMTYTVPLARSGELRLSGVYAYNSGYTFEPSGVIRQDDFSLVNLTAEYRPSTHFGVELWVKNLTNTEYDVSNLAGAFGSNAALGAPRTYGANLKFQF
jgi:iron complex outermembrane recepter protein